MNTRYIEGQPHLVSDSHTASLSLHLGGVQTMKRDLEIVWCWCTDIAVQHWYFGVNFDSGAADEHRSALP